jgi:ribokinase
MLAAVGFDAAGDEALATWASEGIDTRAVVRIADTGTGMAVILVDARGENCIAVDAGANGRLAPGHVGAAAELIGAARVVVAQLETPLDATAAAFTLARGRGVRTVLNAAPAPGALDEALLALTDILVVNEGEGLALSGAQGQAAIGEALLVKAREAVVLTQGAEGATLFRAGRPPLLQASHAVAVVDTTGAGDAFIGALCARLATSGDIESALRWGVAAGALACTARGASVSFAGSRRIAALAEARGQPRLQ